MKLTDLNLLSIGNTVQLTGALYSGEGKVYLCFFPDEVPQEYVETATLEMDRADWEVFLRQSDLVETEVLAKATDGRLTKAIIRKCERNIEEAVRWEVFRRDSYKCRYCGNDKVPLTVDHLVLWEDGGPTTVMNLVSSCKKCNRNRGNMQYETWLVSPYYRRVSAGLDEEVKRTNEGLVGVLPLVPRVAHKRSR